ncbi:uncharacterized protein METZ01_LOCUS433120 [marine metagenome]|uniref:Uncharacterized protein n=1 Tax=marine metagenome TaxID=408172 RepID=A0A382YAC5_9ZZZZ
MNFKKKILKKIKKKIKKKKFFCTRCERTNHYVEKCHASTFSDGIIIIATREELIKRVFIKTI